MTGWIFAAGGVLAAAAWFESRRRLRRMGKSELSDGAIRQIEVSGRVEVDEPLDLEEAAEEEERFWNESWDEPEPL